MTSPAIGLTPLPPPLLAEDPALLPIRADVARRIARVCADVPPEPFARLVDQIARFKRRWQIRETPPT